MEIDAQFESSERKASEEEDALDAVEGVEVQTNKEGERFIDVSRLISRSARFAALLSAR